MSDHENGTADRVRQQSMVRNPVVTSTKGESMKTVDVYWTHAELCEILGVPPEMGLVCDEDALTWRPDAEMWRLSMRVGTEEEVEAAVSGE